MKVGDGTLGCLEHAPYDAIVVTAGAPKIPTPLTDQLADGGRLVIPVGDSIYQTLYVVTKKGQHLEKKAVESVVFVPLVGQEGWSTDSGL